MAEHDPVAEPDRHRAGNALTVQVGAVFAPGITHDETAARANRQLRMDARHVRVVRLDGLDLAFPPASQTDASATRLEALAGGGHEQCDTIGALLGLLGRLLEAGMLGERGFELDRNGRYPVFRAGFSQADHVA